MRNPPTTPFPLLASPPRTSNRSSFCILSHAGRWPLQTRSEDANQGLDQQLVDLITNTRHWLVARGFMTADGPWSGVGGSGSSGDGGGGNGNGGGSGFGIGWRKVVVARTHAAMCASALLKPGWGSGHQIMGEAEQVLLFMTVTV